VACYELGTAPDRPRSHKVLSKCRVGLVTRDNACTLKLGLREHGLCEAWHRYAFMPEKAGRQDSGCAEESSRGRLSRRISMLQTSNAITR
jgi:hypothetical protein